MLYTPSRVFVARPARSAARLVGHAAAAQTRRVQPASLLQAHLQVRRSTRFLGQLYKSGFTELCDVIMRTNETPLAAATHKLNQLKDKAGLSDAPAVQDLLLNLVNADKPPVPEDVYVARVLVVAIEALDPVG